jgi:hypothetical protein
MIIIALALGLLVTFIFYLALVWIVSYTLFALYILSLKVIFKFAIAPIVRRLTT